MVDRQGSLTGSQVLIVVDGEFCGELPFDRGSPLELVIDLHAQAPSRFFELCGDIGCPLSSMGSEFPYLQQKMRKKGSIMGPRTSDTVLTQEPSESFGLAKSCCRRHRFLMLQTHLLTATKQEEVLL